MAARIPNGNATLALFPETTHPGKKWEFCSNVLRSGRLLPRPIATGGFELISACTLFFLFAHSPLFPSFFLLALFFPLPRCLYVGGTGRNTLYGNFDITFGPFSAHFSAQPHPPRTVGRVLLGAQAFPMLIGACHPMLCPIWGYDSSDVMPNLGLQAWWNDESSATEYDSLIGSLQRLG